MNWYGFNVRAHPDNTDSIFVCLFGCLLKTMKTKLYQHCQRKRNEMISNYIYYENISFNIFIQKYFYQQKKYFYFHRKMSKSIDYTQTKSRHREKNFFLLLCNWNEFALFRATRDFVNANKENDHFILH